MSDYSRKIIPICCHAYRVNRVWEEAENWWVNRLTIEPQTFCGLKEIELNYDLQNPEKFSICGQTIFLLLIPTPPDLMDSNFTKIASTLLLEVIVFHRESSMIGTPYPMKLYLHLMY